MSGRTFSCPLCKKELTREEYDATLRVDKAREQEVNKQVKDAFGAGAKQYENQVALLTEQNAKLQDTITHLEKGDTAQKAGFEDEIILLKGLEGKFPDDTIEKHGHYGDVLQIIKYEGSTAGTIVFECKRKANLDAADIRQAYTASQYRKADYAILVTTATRPETRKHVAFDGFIQEKGVFIVRPTGVMSLVEMIRGHIITMIKSQLTPEQRLDANHKLADYLTQGQGNQAINTIIRYSEQSYQRLMGEIRQHRNNWEEQYQNIFHILLAGDALSKNIGVILSGHEPVLLPQSKPPTLSWSGPELPQKLLGAEAEH